MNLLSKYAIIIVEGANMSFDINPSRNLSNVQASSKTSDGGAGNTGYFQRGQSEDEELLGFAKEYPSDSFERVELPEPEDNDSLMDVIKELFASILNFLKSLFVKQKNK